MKKETGKEKKKAKRRIATLAAGAAATAAVAVGSLFQTADELIGPDAEDKQPVTEPVAAALAEPVAQPQKPADKLRAFFLRQNAFVRGALLLPLWALGRGIIAAASLLWAALSPYWGLLLGVVLNALLLFALFAFVYKALFPGSKLGALLKNKRWLWLLLGALLLAAADAALKLWLPDYRAISLFVKLFCGFVVLTTLSFRIFGRKIAQT